MRDRGARQQAVGDRGRRGAEHLIGEILVQFLIGHIVEFVEQPCEPSLVREPREQQHRDRPARRDRGHPRDGIVLQAGRREDRGDLGFGEGEIVRPQGQDLMRRRESREVHARRLARADDDGASFRAVGQEPGQEVVRAGVADRVLGVLEDEGGRMRAHPPGCEREADPVGVRRVAVAHQAFVLGQVGAALRIFFGQRGDEPAGEVDVRSDPGAVAHGERRRPLQQLPDQRRLPEAGRRDQRDDRRTRRADPFQKGRAQEVGARL